MAQLITYRCWFKDGTMMMVCDESSSAAKQQAEKRSRESLKEAYFANKRERNDASTVNEVEDIDS